MLAHVRRLPLVLVLALAAPGCKVGTLLSPSLEGWNYVFVTFNPVDSSGMSGTGVGQFADGAASFEFGAQLGPAVVGQEYVVHAHAGSCTAMGSIVRTLAPIQGRAGGVGSAPSVTINAQLSAAYWQAPYVMDLHRTAAGVERRVACGSFDE